MRKLILAACALVFAVGLVACSGGSASGSAAAGSASASDGAVEGSASSAAEASDSASGATTSETTASSEVVASDEAASEVVASGAAAVGKVDVSTVDFDVAAMDDAEAFAFMDEFTNRTPDLLDADNGKVMHIKGQVSRYTKDEGGVKKVSDSVGIKGEGGVLKSVCFYVEGWTAEDYPENKAQVEVTGVWGVVDGYGTAAGRTLICNAEDVKVL